MYYILAQIPGLLLMLKDKQVTNYDLAVMQTRYSMGDGSVKQGNGMQKTNEEPSLEGNDQGNRNLSSLYVFHSTGKKLRMESSK